MRAYAYTSARNRETVKCNPPFRSRSNARFPGGRGAAIVYAAGTEESLLLILESAKKAHFSRRRVIDRQIQFRADNEMLPERKGTAK